MGAAPWSGVLHLARKGPRPSDYLGIGPPGGDCTSSRENAWRNRANTYVNKLRTLLSAKGVPEEHLEDRIREIKKHIGDAGIKDAYGSFDPWARLKAICPIRLVREAETKTRPKSKDIQKEAAGEDAMQANDPWTTALRERGSWKLDVSFFCNEDGTHPVAIDKISHGTTGIALTTEREAELLQNQSHMSDRELAVVVIGAKLQAVGNFAISDAEVPCKAKAESRILVKAQLLNLGAKRISLPPQSDGRRTGFYGPGL